MLNSVIVKTVGLSVRYRWIVIAAGILLTIGATAFDVARFAINTNVEGLISQKLPWHQRQQELTQAFPQKAITVVVKAPTAENAEQATSELASALSKDPKLFPMVGLPDSGEFFDRNGLLFDSLANLKTNLEGLTKAQPLIAELAGDPSLRGVMKALSFASEGVRAGKIRLDELAWPLSLAERISANAPLAVREALAILNHEVAGDETASWERSDAAHSRLLATQDVKEGVDAFFERRSPRWTGH